MKNIHIEESGKGNIWFQWNGLEFPRAFRGHPFEVWYETQLLDREGKLQLANNPFLLLRLTDYRPFMVAL